MDIAAYFEEQQQQFIDLAAKFQESRHAFQEWEHTYIEHLQHQAQRRRVTKTFASSQGKQHQPSSLVAGVSPAQQEPDAPSDITDEEWQRIAPLFAQHKRAGRPSADTRTTLNGILYVLHAHCAWRAIPARYGNNVTCWRRLLQWQNDGTWERIQRILGCPDAVAVSKRAIPELAGNRGASHALALSFMKR